MGGERVQVIKKINNNVALASNNNEEIIIVGKGVGFPKIPYELVDESIIETVYVTTKNMKAFEILNGIPTEVSELTEEIIKYGEKYLGEKINSVIFLTLSDHINSTIERYKDLININNPLEWQIKHLYPKEYHIGVEATKIIEKRFKIKLPTSEASFIALHFVNCQMGSGEMRKTSEVTSIAGEILNIIKYHFKIDFEETSINFSRFVTHLMYFLQRQLNGTSLQDGNEAVYEMIKEKYIEEIKCVEKIEKHIADNYNLMCSNDEKLYLILHIQRLRI